MACELRNLSALSYANGFTLWHYRTDDPASTIDDNGYFNSAASMLRVGDFILANAGVDDTPQSGVFIVLANAGGEVDVSNLSAFGIANSD
jgi:outer membrane protein assembly factor BamB